MQGHILKENMEDSDFSVGHVVSALDLLQARRTVLGECRYTVVLHIALRWLYDVGCGRKLPRPKAAKKGYRLQVLGKSLSVCAPRNTGMHVKHDY